MECQPPPPGNILEVMGVAIKCYSNAFYSGPSENVIGRRATCFRVLRSFTAREMPKDVRYQQERAKLSELGGKSKSTVEASPSQSNRLRAAGEMRSPGEGPKRMKEVACTRVGGKVVAVEKRELKEGAVPCVEAKVDPGASYGENLKNTKRHFSKRERDFQTNASLASGEKDGAGKMFVMSKSRKQMWDRMRKSVASAPPLVQMKDYRPKGKTYRTGVNKILAEMKL